jgi:hypothetical protein
MKSAALHCVVLVVCAGATVTISAQRGVQGVISAIPAWPADGNIPDNLQDNYIFLGPRLGEIVVSYPNTLDDPNKTGRTTFTFALRNQVRPTFTVQLTQKADGLFGYDYTLHNGESARQSIQSWFMVGPPHDPNFVSVGAGWSARKASAVRAQQIALPTVSQAGATVMFHAPVGQTIPPGNTRAGFHVTSSYSPGFTTAYVMGDVGLIRFPGEVPTVVGDQIGVLQEPQWDSKVAVVLGPRFPAESSPQRIAADFHVGISQLIAGEMLRPDSAFVKAALDLLASALQAGGVPSVAQVLRLPSPAPGLESEIAAAMRINGR